jgi:hypothetical protein
MTKLASTTDPMWEWEFLEDKDFVFPRTESEQGFGNNAFGRRFGHVHRNREQTSLYHFNNFDDDYSK